MILSLRQLKLLVTTTVAVSVTSANWVMAGTSPIKDSSPTLLSAFFGLDNALPFAVNLLCFGGAGILMHCGSLPDSRSFQPLSSRATLSRQPHR